MQKKSPKEWSIQFGAVALFLMVGLAGQLAWAAHAQALDLHVDVESRGGACSDDRDRTGVSATSPWCNLHVAAAAVQPGDTVHVRGGEYSTITSCRRCNDNSVLQIATSGREDAWIRFIGAPSENVRITPNGGAQHGVQVVETYDKAVRPRYVEVTGFTIQGFSGNCVAVKRTGNVTFRSLDVSGCEGGAVELHETDNVTIESSLVHDNPTGGWTSAIDLYLCKSGNVVRGNYIWNNSDEDPRDSEGHGITMDYCEREGGALIENNLIWENEGWCMAIFVSDGGTIRNNTCYQNGRRDEAGEISVLGSRQRIHNNILVPRSGRIALNLRDQNSAYTADLSTVYADYNLMWAPTHQGLVSWPGGNWSRSVTEYRSAGYRGWGANAIDADPLFVDAANRDFRLQASSPTIDSGGVADAASIDARGVARPVDGDGDGSAAPDVGAYEFQTNGSGSDAGPPPPPLDGGPPPVVMGGPSTEGTGTAPRNAGTSTNPDAEVLTAGVSPSEDATMQGGCTIEPRSCSRPNWMLALALLLGAASMERQRRRRAKHRQA